MNTIGQTALGHPITQFHYRRAHASARKVLIIGGVHGDEIEGISAALALNDRILQGALSSLEISLIPHLNVDGMLMKTRGNGNGVDLNRNLPTQDWTAEWTNPRYQPGPNALSEPENQALVAEIERFKPIFILSLHSWKPILNVNEPESSKLCHRIAEHIAQFTKAPVEPTIGYSTPGCLGTYAGLERGIPTLTYEIERGLALSEVLKKHTDPILSGLSLLETNT